MSGVVDASRLFHSYGHALRPFRRCRSSPVESVQHVWSEWHEDPRLTLACWVERFLAVCDATHPPSPAERAAAILRERFRTPPDLGALAKEVGSSRSALTRTFKIRYGMSCGEYLTRVRLRWFIDEVRKPGSNAGRLAAEAGYLRYHNLLDALRWRTGCTPCDVRRLTDNNVRELLDGRLSLLPCRIAKVLES